MVGEENTVFLILPPANAVAVDVGVGEYVIDLHRLDSMIAMVGTAGACGKVDHSGKLSHQLHFFAVWLGIHIADENAGCFGEKYLAVQLLRDLPDSQDPGGMALMIQVGVGQAEHLVRGDMMEGGFRADPGTVALDLVAGSGNEGGGREPVAIELHKIEASGEEGDTGLFTLEADFSGAAYDIVVGEVFLQPQGNVGKHLLETDDIRLFTAELLKVTSLIMR